MCQIREVHTGPGASLMTKRLDPGLQEPRMTAPCEITYCPKDLWSLWAIPREQHTALIGWDSGTNSVATPQWSYCVRLEDSGGRIILFSSMPTPSGVKSRKTKPMICKWKWIAIWRLPAHPWAGGRQLISLGWFLTWLGARSFSTSPFFFFFI